MEPSSPCPSQARVLFHTHNLPLWAVSCGSPPLRLAHRLPPEHGGPRTLGYLKGSREEDHPLSSGWCFEWPCLVPPLVFFCISGPAVLEPWLGFCTHHGYTLPPTAFPNLMPFRYCWTMDPISAGCGWWELQSTTSGGHQVWEGKHTSAGQV